MNCQQCSEHLSAYLDGALAESQRQALESHCAGCVRCAAERDDLQKILRALPQLPQPTVPENFRRRVWAQIDAHEFASKPKKWRLDSWLIKLPVGALAMAAVVLLVARISQDTLPQLTKPAALSDVAAARFVPNKNEIKRSQLVSEEKESAQGMVAQRAASVAAPRAMPPQAPALLKDKDSQSVSRKKMDSDSSSATISETLSLSREDWRLFVEDTSVARASVLRILEEFNAFNIQPIQSDTIRFQIAASQQDYLIRYLGELGELQPGIRDNSTTGSAIAIRLTIVQKTS